MTTVKGKSGRVYEVRTTTYGTLNHVHRVYYGDIYLSGTDSKDDGSSGSCTLEIAIEKADRRAEMLNITID